SVIRFVHALAPRSRAPLPLSPVEYGPQEILISFLQQLHRPPGIRPQRPTFFDDQKGGIQIRCEGEHVVAAKHCRQIEHDEARRIASLQLLDQPQHLRRRQELRRIRRRPSPGQHYETWNFRMDEDPIEGYSLFEVVTQPFLYLEAEIG